MSKLDKGKSKDNMIELEKIMKNGRRRKGKEEEQKIGGGNKDGGRRKT